MAKRTKIDTEAKSIPHDVITLVFPNLPAKTLVRFRSVSKLWLSELRDPQLAELHRSRSGTRTPPVTSIVMACTDRLTSKQTLFFSDISGRLNPSSPLHTIAYEHVSQVVNGSICMINPDRVSVCNLSTRDIIDLPESSWKPKQNPSKTHHSRFLFGFDPRSHEYKVVKINTTVAISGPTSNKCEVYTLGTKSWRRIKIGPCKFSGRCKDPGVHTLGHIPSVCINGAIHWIQNPSDDTHGTMHISVFDVGSERFVRRIDFPRAFPSTNMKLVEIGGKLALVGYNRKIEHCSYDTWSIRVLEDYEKPSWTNRTVLGPYFWRTPHCFPVGSSFSDKIFMFRWGKNLVFEALCFDLSKPNNKPKIIRFFDVDEACLKICGRACIGDMDSVAFFVTDKMDNMLPMKTIV